MTKQSVAIPPIRTSSPCRWSVPKQPADISKRGRIYPMVEEPRADWFHWTMRALFVAIALAGIVFQYNGGFQ